ncbi:hypothetical protein C7N43_07080 [Sphingobacteriales bacterium UPWRP_1]|nr:hypothetical protein B6N25_04570 [Sphingobacteriales bacterium TSM_CSS]PSJ77743.1 hypothetical protein C7N43_07080 [Sphingobacteriales bacterium UPWRP_1]
MHKQPHLFTNKYCPPRHNGSSAANAARNTVAYHSTSCHLKQFTRLNLPTMKDRIAFWAEESNEKILVIVRLRLEDDIFDIWTMPKSSISDEFEKKALANDTIDQIDLEQLPEPHTHIERSVMEEYLLPETIKTHETLLVKRAETEWRVKVLSNKLSQQLEKTIDGLFEQVKSLTEYDNEVWDLTKTFWDKVNTHYQEKDLTREHAGMLRDKINEAFNILKSLRKSAQEQFGKEARQVYEQLSGQVKKITDSFSQKSNLNAVFDQLKKLQEEANKVRLGAEMRKQLSELLNNAFEMVKAERQKSGLRHLENRIKGLQDVIARMEKSIKEDNNELNFQKNRLQHTSGQLEAQLREAKMQMIKTQLESKEVKLADMLKTLEGLNNQLKQEQKRYGNATGKQPKDNLAEKKSPNKDKKKNRNNDEKPSGGGTTTPEIESATEQPVNTGTEDITPGNETPKLPETQHHFYEPVQETDVELYMEEKPVKQVNPEDYADGDGTYDFDREDRSDT